MILIGSGTNNLIKKGAILVTSPEDIFKHLNISYIKDKINNHEESNLNIVSLKDEYKELYNLITKTSISIQELCIKSNLPINILYQKLTFMELEGYIKSLSGNKFVRL